jgi:SAM-dependent methyltransferase
LDVGCATGNFLYEMSRQTGWQVDGVEPSAYAAQLARDSLGLNIQQARLEDAGFKPGSFDVVTLWNVLEHVPSPMTTLRYVYQVLGEGGILIISVPVVDSTLASLFGPYWAEWDLPRHLYIFSHKTIESLTGAIGFKEIEVKASISEYRVFFTSLENLFRERLSNMRLQRLASAMVRFPLARAVGSLILRATIPLGRSSVPVFVLQKMERAF